MQWYVMATSTWSEKILSFEVEYLLRNAKHMFFLTWIAQVFLKWQFRMKIHYSSEIVEFQTNEKNIR